MRPNLALARVAIVAIATWPACSETAAGDVASESTATACSDEADNDRDGWTDCADQDCWVYTDASPQLIPSGQVVTGQILDGVMAAYLGKTTLSITFDRGPQIAPEAPGAGTFTQVQASFSPLLALSNPGLATEHVPLVLSYVPGAGAGRVIYTNFHNDAQTTADMLEILNYLVFTL